MSDVLVEIVDGVAVLTLDRPQQRNAFTGAMGRTLGDLYRALDADDDVRVLVLTGTPPAFCAGADLTAGTDTFAAPTHDGFSASPVNPPAFDLRKPVIAAVNGHAIGIGLTLAMQADIRIVADDAKYAIPQVRRGVVPDAMSHWTVPRAAGMAAAAEILLTGRTFDGPEAVRLGIASRSLPADEVLPAALAMARDIATNVAPMSAALSKRLLWDTARYGFSPERVAEFETELHHRVMGSADASEGVRAFLDRRDPDWSARVSTDWKELPWE
ncbi:MULTISPECIES: enoyl-CoA hydratase/isomerase family protein [unclassified Rhodococcus (in: high G+C Gram-positive bacteria)]|uniref:enoyl-CoA hydratase/isomerase family protein n=1 Tax=unclassified Rhodococcus (in: high G+C Gram-positive bacteria) TaxID=192944 RepID=UPI000E0BB832|nr:MULTISPECIES: enoyl-CoA hydratase-related protein [unclassified Rhodococcus (in: high G+C Gram-positive bacteria)]QKT10360.1 enoyl-CoA hydratase/isomerase family protein [Rhodococcus sp. W8901]RDI20552.1 enoyl-CoA hydratase/carnithine racemase [Rhodococcus sp. AG1013]